MAGEPIHASLLWVPLPHHHATHHRPAAHSWAIVTRHPMLAAVRAHWPSLSILKIALLGRAGEERDANGHGRSQRGGEQYPFHGKTSVKIGVEPEVTFDSGISGQGFEHRICSS
jgi:hypothetical protein